MFGHRGQAVGAGMNGGASRFPELIEALRSEYEALQQECNFLRHQKEDIDIKAHDIAMVHKIFGDLEKAHVRMQQHYEEEINRLKSELESHQTAVNRGRPAALKFHPLPNLEQEMLSIGSSFLAAPVPGIPDSVNLGYFVRRTSDNEHMQASRSEDSLLTGRNHTTGKYVSGSRSFDEAPGAATAGQKERAGGYDWLVVYNPKVPRSLTVDLKHTLVHDGVVCAVRFNSDGRLLATGSNKAVRLFEAHSGSLLSTFSDTDIERVEEDQFFRTVAFSPDGKWLASGAEDAIIRVWDLESGELLFRLEGHEQDVYSIEFFDNGDKLASGSGDKTVRLWDMKTRKCIGTLHAGTPDSSKDSGITSLSVSPNGKFLAAGSLDRLIRIWALPGGQPIDVIEGHQDSIYSLAFTSDGRHLLSGSLDKSIRLWEFESPDYLKGALCRFDVAGHKDFVLSVTGSPDSRIFLTGSKDRSVQCWDRQTGTLQFMLQGHKNSVIGLAFTPSGNMFATASGDFRARLWTCEPSSEDSAAEEESAQSDSKQRRISKDEVIEEASSDPAAEHA